MRERPQLLTAMLAVVVLVAVAVVAAVALSGRDDGADTATATASVTTGGAAVPTLTATGSVRTQTATGTQVTVTSTPQATATSSGTPASTTTAGGAPPGYQESCAASHPWGRQVDEQFVCIESPSAAARVEQPFEVRGYAGGAFESTLLVSLVLERNDGTRVPATGTMDRGITYRPPDIGMPGSWSYRVDGLEPHGGGTLRVRVSVQSPRDGSTVAAAEREFRLTR